MEYEALPGGELIRQGVEDLRCAKESVPALLVLVGAPRLRRIGLPIPESTLIGVERRLYELLADENPDSAHSRYNALLRMLVSFERAAECAG